MRGLGLDFISFSFKPTSIISLPPCSRWRHCFNQHISDPTNITIKTKLLQWCQPGQPRFEPYSLRARVCYFTPRPNKGQRYVGKAKCLHLEQGGGRLLEHRGPKWVKKKILRNKKCFSYFYESQKVENRMVDTSTTGMNRLILSLNPLLSPLLRPSLMTLY